MVVCDWLYRQSDLRQIAHDCAILKFFTTQCFVLGCLLIYMKGSVWRLSLMCLVVMLLILMLGLLLLLRVI